LEPHVLFLIMQAVYLPKIYLLWLQLPGKFI
jgi:hypothetical protein